MGGCTVKVQLLFKYSCLTNFYGNYNIEDSKCGEKEE